MRSLKRRGAAALAVAIPLSIGLAACGSGSDSATSASGDDGAASSNELTVWASDPAFNIYALREAEKIFQRDHPDFRLNIEDTSWDDVQTKLATLARSQEYSQLPDIFLMQNKAFQKNLASFPEVFANFDDSSVNFDEFPKSAIDYSTVDGTHYGVPFDSGTAFAAYRTDVLEEAGLKVSDFESITWNDFIEKAKLVRDKTGKPMLSGQAVSPDLIMMMLQSAGASLFDDEGKPTIADNAVLEQAVDVYTTMVKEGILREVNNWDEYIATFVNSEVAAVHNGVWVVGSMKQAQDQSGLWEITNFPKLDGVEGATNYTVNGGSSWAVSSEGNISLAQEFLAATFAGSTEFYDTIIPESGAVGYWIPAGESAVYKEPQEFFAGQPIYEMVVGFAEKVPSNNAGDYYREARDAVGVALTSIIGGADPTDALKEAQETVVFAMQ